MNFLGREAQILGKEAENRVVRLSLEQGYTVHQDPIADYAHKIDVYIEGVGCQVSVAEKSRRERDKLAKRNVFCIIAGKQLEDSEVISQIVNILSYSQNG